MPVDFFVPVIEISFISHVQATELVDVYRKPIFIFFPENSSSGMSPDLLKLHDVPAGHVMPDSLVVVPSHTTSTERMSAGFDVNVKFTA